MICFSSIDHCNWGVLGKGKYIAVLYTTAVENSSMSCQRAWCGSVLVSSTWWHAGDLGVSGGLACWRVGVPAAKALRHTSQQPCHIVVPTALVYQRCGGSCVIVVPLCGPVQVSLT